MKEYFLGVAVLSMLCSATVALAPAGASQKYIRLLSGLALALCVAAPIFSLIADGGLDAALEDMLEAEASDVQDYAEIYNNAILKAGSAGAEKTLKSEILQALNGNDGDIDLNIVAHLEGEEIYIDLTEIIIYPSGLPLDPHFMQNYVSERLGCRCEVIYMSDE